MGARNAAVVAPSGAADRPKRTREPQREPQQPNILYGHCLGCNITEAWRWRTGPDGTRTLCESCFRVYRKGRMKIYQSSNGLSCLQTPGSTPVYVVGLQAISPRLRYLHPIVGPSPVSEVQQPEYTGVPPAAFRVRVSGPEETAGNAIGEASMDRSVLRPEQPDGCPCSSTALDGGSPYRNVQQSLSTAKKTSPSQSGTQEISTSLHEAHVMGLISGPIPRSACDPLATTAVVSRPSKTLNNGNSPLHNPLHSLDTDTCGLMTKELSGHHGSDPVLVASDTPASLAPRVANGTNPGMKNGPRDSDGSNQGEKIGPRASNRTNPNVKNGPEYCPGDDARTGDSVIQPLPSRSPPQARLEQGKALALQDVTPNWGDKVRRDVGTEASVEEVDKDVLQPRTSNCHLRDGIVPRIVQFTRDSARPRACRAQSMSNAMQMESDIEEGEIREGDTQTPPPTREDTIANIRNTGKIANGQASCRSIGRKEHRNAKRRGIAISEDAITNNPVIEKAISKNLVFRVPDLEHSASRHKEVSPGHLGMHSCQQKAACVATGRIEKGHSGKQGGRSASKVHIKATCNNATTRRFTVLSGLSFVEFKDSLRSCFDMDTDLVISYKDEEGDMVTVSTENEMEELLRLTHVFSVSPVRVYVMPR